MHLIRPPRPLSIGARLTLAYSAVMFLTVSVTALFVYLSIERKVHQEARLILRYYLAEVLEELDSRSAGAEAVVGLIIARLGGLDTDLQPSVAIFDDQGNRVVAQGILATRPVPLSDAVLGQGEREAIAEVDLGSPHPYLVAAAPCPIGFAQVAIYTKRFERDVRGIRRTLALALPLILVLTGAGGWWIARRSLRPIAEITATARRITGEELDARIPITGSNDELDQLAVTLNDMIARLRSSMEKLRRVSADAAHQLKSPLASLRNRIEVTLETEALGDRHQADLEALLAEIVDLSDGVAAMLQLARSEAGLAPGQARTVDLRALLDSVVSLYSPMAQERQISLRLDAAAGMAVLGDPSWLSQLFGNLLDNAIRFTEPGGSVEVSLRRQGGEALVRVADTGIGIAPEDLERVFERFHRGNLGRETSGFGLGLAVAREVTREHGGRIEAQSRPGAGSVFSVTLPTAD